MLSLRCDTIHHSYDGERDAVNALSLELRAGEVMALIGPNGAGKSTSLRIMATLQRPDRGRVLWDGADAWARRYELRPRIGFLGDGTGLYPTMRAAEYLAFFAACYGQPQAEARRTVEELLERFDLAPKAEAVISDLSKGMRQRLAIARTMVHQPELLLLDEPADGLDPLGRRRLRELLREVAARGVAIVVSSHILRELDGFCDSVVVMQGGRVVVSGGVDEVIERYEVGRRVWEVRVCAGLSAALEVLARHEGLVEALLPLDKGDPRPGPSDPRGRIHVRVHGDDAKAAGLLAALVQAGCQISGFVRLRGDLEDVYQSVGSDTVS